MGDPKPSLVLWSKAAAAAAGSNIVPVQAKFVGNASDIVSSARDWFFHALPHEGESACSMCTGHELPDIWQVFVQSALYKPMTPLPDDHPDPERRGKGFNVPEVIEGPGNEVFAAYDDIVG